MRKTIIAMLAFIFVSISGISYAADKVFALVPKAMNNPFFDLARDGCKVAEKEIGGIECLYIGPGEHTEQEQVQIVQDLIAKGVDGIAVASSNAAAMAKCCGYCNCSVSHLKCVRCVPPSVQFYGIRLQIGEISLALGKQQETGCSLRGALKLRSTEPQ